MNLLAKFVNNYIDYFGQNLGTAHLAQEHDAGCSLKITKQSVKDKQHKFLKKNHSKSKQAGQNASNTNTKNSKEDQDSQIRTEVSQDQGPPYQRTAKPQGLK